MPWILTMIEDIQINCSVYTSKLNKLSIDTGLYDILERL